MRFNILVSHATLEMRTSTGEDSQAMEHEIHVVYLAAIAND